MVLVGITHTDTEVDVDYLANKLMGLKLWDDAKGKNWASNVKDNGF